MFFSRLSGVDLFVMPVASVGAIPQNDGADIDEPALRPECLRSRGFFRGRVPVHAESDGWGGCIRAVQEVVGARHW